VQGYVVQNLCKSVGDPQEALMLKSSMRALLWRTSSSDGRPLQCNTAHILHASALIQVLHGKLHITSHGR
jgi:hypothetical protein